MSGSVSNLNEWLAEFATALERGEVQGVAELFAEGGFWRDLVAFTWNIRTFEGRAEIAEMIAATPEVFRSFNWNVEIPEQGAAQEGFIRFETPLGRGSGFIRLAEGKCSTLLTTLQELRGYEERRGRRRPVGFKPHPDRPLENWKDAREAEVESFARGAEPYVLIVGGGQGGLALAARLRQLDVPHLIVERNARPGDQWRSRYHSLSLHDPVWYDHLPYLPFPDTWPVYSPKDKIADWLDAYASIMELNVWPSTNCVAAQYDEGRAAWSVNVVREGQQITLRPRHLVLAVGNAGRPNMPKFQGAETFAGPLIHSSQHAGGEGYGGKKVAVIGSNNSAHDICADLIDHGADVTMIQKDSTHIIRSETSQEVFLKGAYSEDALAAGITTERADLVAASLPLRIAPMVFKALNDEVARRDAEFYRRLEAAGFMHDFGEDGTGMPLKYLRRASGYYIDVGAAELVANGTIKLVSNVSVDRLEPGGVVVSDGRKVQADAIICATGFGSMDQVVADLISPEVAQRVGKAWGYGSDTFNDPGPWEGEIRNMWKPTAQPGLWFHGGNLSQSRFYSLFLALQLKARHVGLPVRVYPGRNDAGRAPQAPSLAEAV
ncbi:NAD(P)/FAD-dependent oxidoreductase [Phenylobacterium sp.]|uniref:NAD(P)/FAD-dependent oxidoreductase n=1 Tax=Phenylobacterium sp. TaxID=1871053 RepID=UPI002BF5E37C|nr:NAD(P)/FAD-dependent oxidoreductase [Phenylobacterium sp.]HVI33615.1 NAD(P)/FAD-dependent oxidoreductase [Phenylobacterium sp.]